MSINILPFSLGNITSFRVEVYQVVLFVKARLRVSLYDENGSLLNIKDMDIEGEDYLNWNNDDKYVVDYVCNKLGFALAP